MTDDEKAELAGVYERAADYLEEYGWKRGGAGYQDHPRCIIGSTLSAEGNHYSSIWYRANRFIEEVLELPLGGLMIWNDDPTRTADEVINTLHALANKLR